MSGGTCWICCCLHADLLDWGTGCGTFWQWLSPSDAPSPVSHGVDRSQGFAVARALPKLVQPDVLRKQQLRSHLHGFVPLNTATHLGCRGCRLHCGKHSPSPIFLAPFGFCPGIFLDTARSVCICNPHLVPGDTAQRPSRTGEGVSGARLHGDCGRGWWCHGVRSTGTGHFCFTPANVVAVVSSTIGVRAGPPGSEVPLDLNGGLFLSGPLTPGDSSHIPAFV